MHAILRHLLTGASATCLAIPVFANPCPPGNPPTNCAPPPNALLDLDGSAINHAYSQYFASFVALDPLTNISFALREDPAFLFLDDVSVSTGGGPNLLLNPGFELGPLGANAPAGWTYLNNFGATFAGVVSGSGPHSGALAYVDGAVQAYDGITQAVATTPGSTYDVSFWLSDNGPLTQYRRVSDNGDVSGTGGNGVDLLLYAGAVPVLPSVPEPAMLALFAPGLLTLAWMARRRTRQGARAGTGALAAPI
ncbi:MAG: hypothetical protein V4582_22380 [Pseudomonadota bacterium]